MKAKDFPATSGEPISEGKLGKVVHVRGVRKNGTRVYGLDFSNCPTMTEQHTAHLTDINYLMKRYKPDELAAYLNARAEHRRAIEGHDFSKEPSFQEANNIIARSRNAFRDLPEDIRGMFQNHVEFLKFIDNPGNQQKMIRMGLLTPKQVKELVVEPSGSVDKGATAPASGADSGAKK